MVKAVRGAIKVSSNTKEAIYRASVKLIKEIIKQNGIAEEDIISIIFSVTKDLNKANPAAGLRAEGFRQTPLLCVQEAETEGDCEGIVRILLTFNTLKRASLRPVYLDGAEVLRPDLLHESR